MVSQMMHTSLGAATYNDWSDHTGNPWGIRTNLRPNAFEHDSEIEKAKFVEAELRVAKKEEKKMKKTKRGLYQVILVNPKAGEIIFNDFVICSNLEDVLLEADASRVIKDASLQVHEVDKIINFLGEIRRTKKNKDGIAEIIDSDTNEG